MIRYFLPSTGIYGGIKVGFQLVAVLRRLGARAVVVTPEGTAPAWFRASVPVLAEAEALPAIRGGDVTLFSLPHDHRRLAALPGRLVFHCQGTDPLIDPIVDDPRVTMLACWPQAARYMAARGRDDVRDVGIAVAEAFFSPAVAKVEGTVAYMPRRGADLVAACRERVPSCRYLAIDGVDEAEAASLLHAAELYLGTAAGEWFGLPALEAMAAGCVVLSVPTLGGTAYLDDGRNCHVCDPAELPDVLAHLTSPASRATRARLRDAARTTAAAYRERVVVERVGAWLADDAALRAAA